MPKTRIITVVKVPLIASEKIDKPAIFPPMPTMFLELFENKSKLRRDYVNKGYKENEDEIKKSPKPTSKKRLVKNEGSTSTQHPVGQRQPPEDLSKSAVVVEPPPTKRLNMTKASAKPESGRFMNAPNVNDELTRMIQHTEEGYAVEDGYQQRDESSDEDMVDIDMLRRRLEQMTTNEEEDDDDLSDIADSITDEKNNSVAADSVDKSGSSVGGMSDASELSEISFDSKYTTPRDKRGYVNTERDM